MSSAAGFRRVIAQPAVTDAAVGVVVSGVLLAGVARPGFPLLRDWVATPTPTPPLSDAALGLGESAARAVPQDVAVAWATRALGAVGLPVWPLTGLLTAVFCVWLAVAAGALVRRVAPAGRAAEAWLRLPAVVGAVWNPFVVERLLQGHWSLLAGAAAVVSMPVLLARGRPRGAAACAALAAAGLTPTGWVLAVVAAVVALACGGGGARRARAAVALAAAAVVTALPWALATALTAAAVGGADAAAGVVAFAARAEPGIGTLGSVVALGGIWNSQAVPPSRATWWAAAALVALLLVWTLAARGLWRARRDPVVRATVPVALAAWLLVAAAATGPGLAAMEALVTAVPGAGLLRDTQKFVALALPATVLALAFAARALATRAGAARAARGLPARARPIAAGMLVTAVAVAAVPDAPRTLWQQLRPVTYGPGWERVAGIVDGRPGDLLVLPAGSFRSTPLWADGRPVLDPAPRLLDTRVLVPGDLVVAGAGTGAGDATAVPGEGDRARRATEALLRGADPRELAGMGVRWVLDERTSAGPRGAADETLTATTTRFSDPELTLHELAPPDGPGDADSRWNAVTPPGAPAWARAAVLAAHALWLLTLAGAAVASGRPGRRSRR